MSPTSASMIGKKVEEYIKEWRESDEPLELAPHFVGVHPQNRGGADPNVQTLHNKILHSFFHDGYDPTRHLIPIVVRCSSEASKKALVEHNTRLAEGRPGYPATDEKSMEYGTIAGSHLTLAMRCVANDVPCRASGFGSKSLAEKQPNLKHASTRGLKYWVLRGDTPLHVIQAITSWRNRDQNTNQHFHEIEALVLIDKHSAAEKAKSKDQKVPLANVVALVEREAPVKLGERQKQGQCRYVLQFYKEGQGNLVSELCRWHSAHIDPQELTLPSTIWETLSNVSKYPALEDAPFVRMHLALAAYTPEGALDKSRPTPDQANLINANDLDTFLRKPHRS